MNRARLILPQRRLGSSGFAGANVQTTWRIHAETKHEHVCSIWAADWFILRGFGCYVHKTTPFPWGSINHHTGQVIVLMAERLDFHTNVHFQQLKTVSKYGTSSPKLVFQYFYQWNSAVFPHGNAQVPFCRCNLWMGRKLWLLVGAKFQFPQMLANGILTIEICAG